MELRLFRWRNDEFDDSEEEEEIDRSDDFFPTMIFDDG